MPALAARPPSGAGLGPRNGYRLIVRRDGGAVRLLLGLNATHLHLRASRLG